MANPEQPAGNSMDLPAFETPVFNCLIYLLSQADGTIRARVANLAGLECQASNQRDALAKLVPEFKRRIGQYVSQNENIPWLDPPSEIEPGEQERYVPVHL